MFSVSGQQRQTGFSGSRRISREQAPPALTVCFLVPSFHMLAGEGTRLNWKETQTGRHEAEAPGKTLKQFLQLSWQSLAEVREKVLLYRVILSTSFGPKTCSFITLSSHKQTKS